MKNWLFYIVVCTGIVTGPVIAADHVPRYAFDLVDFEAVMSDIAKLSGEEPLPNGAVLSNRFSEANKNLVRGYLRHRLGELELAVTEENFQRQPVENGQTITLRGQNLLAEVKGGDPTLPALEIVTHYDSQSPVVVGADDNGTGVAAALELARVLKFLGVKRTVRFIFSDYEEWGLWGSEAHVKKLIEGGEAIFCALVIDMIGFSKPSAEILLELEMGRHPQNRSMANAMLRQISAYDGRGARYVPLTFGSDGELADHGPYWDKGLPAVLVTERQITPVYHTPQDQIRALNTKFLAGAVRMVAVSAALLAEARLPDQLRSDYESRLPYYQASVDLEATADRNYVAAMRPLTNYIRKMFTAKLSTSWHAVKELLSFWRRRTTQEPYPIQAVYEGIAADIALFDRLQTQLENAGEQDKGRLQSEMAQEMQRLTQKWGAPTASPEGYPDVCSGLRQGLEELLRRPILVP